MFYKIGSQVLYLGRQWAGKERSVIQLGSLSDHEVSTALIVNI